MRPKARVLALIVLFSNLAEVGKEDVIRTVMEAAKEGRHPLAPATASFGNSSTLLIMVDVLKTLP